MIITYNNIESHQKSGLHPLSRKHRHAKIHVGCQIDHPQVFLGLIMHII